MPVNCAGTRVVLKVDPESRSSTMHSGGVAVTCASFGHNVRLRFPVGVESVVVVRGNANRTTPASAKVFRSALEVLLGSTAQVHDVPPAQVSTEQPLRSSQSGPASAGPVQDVDAPEQVTGGRHAGDRQTEPASRSGFAGQSGLSPSHTASASQGNAAALHAVVRRTLTGHRVEAPEQRSSTSHTPAEPRQMTPPSTGTVLHWPLG